MKTEKARITKSCGDYFYNDKICTGKFWKVEIIGGITLYYPGSRTKKSIIISILGNLGQDTEITECKRINSEA